MTHVSSLLRRISMAGLLLATAPVFVACTPQIALVPSRAADADFHTITVLGRGEVSAKPDIARAQLGVEVTAPTVAEATRLAASRMTAIMGALRSSGIADKDIRTSNFSVSREQPQPGYPQPGYPFPMPMPEMMPAPDAPSAPVAPPAPVKPGSKGAAGASAAASPMILPAPGFAPPPRMVPPQGREFYRVSNTVEVTVRDLERVGPVIDAALAAGANNVWGVSFAVEKTDALEAQAREKASADAKARAEALAKQQGVSPAGVVSISEVFDNGGPFPMPMAMAVSRDSSGGTPMSPGEITFSTQVRVVYALAGGAAAPISQ
jgi:uncharacterized protein YggE